LLNFATATAIVSIAEYDDRPDVEDNLRKDDIGITYLPTSNEFETWELMR